MPSPLRVYLAGPMRGYVNFNYPAFDHAAKRLRQQGLDVFSPADEDRRLFPGKTDAEVAAQVTGRVVFKADTAWICEHADMIALLPGWEKSEGATMERQLGRALGLTIMELGKEYVL